MVAVLICRDALEDSVLGNVALARTLATHDGSATVIFTNEALWALANGTFQWSSNFKGREMRSAVVRGADARGHCISDRNRDPRWTDIRAFVRAASTEPGLRMVACPLWRSFLGLTSEPDYLEQIDESALAALLASAQTIIGGY